MFPHIFFDEERGADDLAIRVLAYSSFLQPWGAGPELAKRFEEKTGLRVKWINAGNGGLLMERLKFRRKQDRPDLVIGFDQFSVVEAQANFRWKPLDAIQDKGVQLLPNLSEVSGFVPYDWGPLTFISKGDALPATRDFEDLLKPEYRNKLVLQDPRMSSPGLQFFFWVLGHFGEEKGFEFLKQLKPSIKVISPSWSSSYSYFKLQQPSSVFSYFTSPFYHRIEENDDSYVAQKFTIPHPLQVEYLGIPDFCTRCEGAKKFADFLLEEESQKILMSKNYMYPVMAKAVDGSEFQVPSEIQYFDPSKNRLLISRKRELIQKWKKIFY